MTSGVKIDPRRNLLKYCSKKQKNEFKISEQIYVNFIKNSMSRQTGSFSSKVEQKNISEYRDLIYARVVQKYIQSKNM